MLQGSSVRHLLWVGSGVLLRSLGIDDGIIPKSFASGDTDRAELSLMVSEGRRRLLVKECAVSGYENS
jgi:hypothetical protein